MDRDQAMEFLACVGVHPSSTVYSESGWVRAPCPLAPWTHDSGKDSNPSFAVRLVDGGKSTFNCFTCEAGSLSHLLWLLKMHGAQAPKYKLAEGYALLELEEAGGTDLKPKDWGQKDEEEKVVPWPESFLYTFIPALKSPRAMEYLSTRDVSVKMALDLMLVYDPVMDTVCFPIRDWHGKLCGLRGRHIDAETAGKPYHMYKYEGGHNKLVWLGENRVDLSKPVLLVESVFDYASALRVYENTLAPLTVGMNENKVKRLKSSVEIVTLFDLGAGGDKARNLIWKYLPSVMINHVLPPDAVSPITGKTVKDPGDMSVEQLVESLQLYLPIG